MKFSSLIAPQQIGGGQDSRHDPLIARGRRRSRRRGRLDALGHNSSMPSQATPAWDVGCPFVQRLVVGPDDIDRFGHANNVAYLAWLERVAWAHTTAVGMDFEAYQRLGTACVARRHELDYLLPTFVGEELDVGTWIAENDGRVAMWRHYQVVRVADRRTVLRGRSQWVCVDMATGKPKRQPPAFISAYRPLDQDK